MDWIEKQMLKDYKKKTIKYEKKLKSISADWNENIITIINMILPEGSRGKVHDLIKVLSKEKHVVLNHYYIETY